MKNTVLIILPFIIISLIYLILRSIYIKAPPIVEYKIALNLESIKAFFWYFLWSLGVPEEFKKQIVGNLIVFNGIFLRDYYQLVIKSFVSFFAIILLGFVYPIYKQLRTNAINFRLLLFLAIWFCAAISPVLLLVNHTFMMYLTLSSIPIYFAISYLVNQLNDKLLILLIIIIWIYISTTTVNFYKNNFFTNRSQQVSREFAKNILTAFPTLPKNSVLYYDLPLPQDQLALLDQEALKAIYNDPTLTIHYTKESLLNYLWQSTQVRPVYIYTIDYEK